MSWSPASERMLLGAVRFGVALVLLTPLVVATHTAYPYSVGKAVYARSIIEVVFVLWVMLALAWPAWRPPRSWLLVLLAAGFGVSVLSAVFGVSPLRSFWSTYMRMQGVVELAHWLAFAVVLVSVFRTSVSLARLLTLNLGVGLLVSLGAIVLYFGGEIPLLGLIPAQEFTRVSATLGNSTYLGAYLMVNVVLALGFLVRSFMPTSLPLAPKGARRGAGGGKVPAPRDAWTRWVERGFYGLSALLGLWGISISGSMAALLGLLAAGGALALLYSFLARSHRLRLVARVVLGLLASGMAVGVLVLFLTPSLMPSFDSPVLSRVTDLETIERTLGNRMASWRAGLRGYAARPVLGWGQDNYEVAFGRYVTGQGTIMPTNDHAHNVLIEVATTTGTLGLAAYLAIWVLTFVAILRGARGVDDREQAFALFAGAALLSQWVQTQTLFHTSSSMMLYVLLLAVAVRFERSAWPPKAGPKPSKRPASVLPRKIAGGCVLFAAVTLSGAGLASNQAIYAGAAALYRAEVFASVRFMAEMKNAIEAFGPQANVPRFILFENLSENWRILRVHQQAEAARLLRWVNVESVRAVEAEPENWLVQNALARLYRAVASTNPEYAGHAKRHYERALELAPNRNPYLPLDTPHWRDGRNH